MARITVEDCLQRENNRFALVLLASKRAKQLLDGATPLTDIRDNKSVVGALREIAASKVRFMTEDDYAEEARRKAEAEVRAESEAALSPTNGQSNHSPEAGIDEESSSDDGSESNGGGAVDA